MTFYVAYYASQRSGDSAHSPRSCLPGGGWEMDDLSQRKLPASYINGQPVRVNRVQIQKGEAKQLVYYWFQQRGRVIDNEFARQVVHLLGRAHAQPHRRRVGPSHDPGWTHRGLAEGG